MDGKILANSLVSLKGTDLRMVYALLLKTNITQLLSSKTKDFLTKEETDHFTNHLEKEMKKVEAMDDAMLQVDLFLEMTKLLKLRGTKYTVQKEIEDQCNEIVRQTYATFQKQNKKFRSFSEKQSNTTELQQLVNFQMMQVFSEFDDNFDGFSIEDQTKFAQKVNEYILSLPKEKQEKIKEKLGVDQLTNEVVRKAIATSGTSIVFAIIVEVSGFAFYTTATSLIASFAGLLGLTLPFGFYTGLTSTIAIVANPLFIIPLLLGGGVLIFNQQNKSLKKKLLPITVMQVALPYMSEGGDSVEFEPFIKEWGSRYQHYVQRQTALLENEAKQEEKERQIKLRERTIRAIDMKIVGEFGRITDIRQEIRSSLKGANLKRLEVGRVFTDHADEYHEITRHIADLKQKKKKMKADTGVWKQIGNTFSNFSSSMDIRSCEKRRDEVLDRLVDDVLNASGTYKRAEREAVEALDLHIEDLKEKRAVESNQKQALEQECNNLRGAHHLISKKIKNMEKQYHGLRDLAVSM
ncbi:hypothetical protein LCM20_16780 [Halobacillus litoralis]|uniref:hypothetical protein n=1 Tax=Halobacillus litoralis TaxID=45668 RepID=UPI001CD33FEC|nr:hypothetical protein [Halobacillus litoralis]MCA0972266.1 hypothetical protein [Halobacillus litoralis]